MNIMRLLKTFIGYICVIIIGIISGIPCLIIACLPTNMRRDNRIFYFFTYIFYIVIRWATFTPITIKGEKNLPISPVIFVSNHLSALDIPYVGSIIGNEPHVWLFLKKYMYVPIFGFIAQRMNVVVDLSNRRALMRAVKEAIILGKEHKRHIVIFPEGGRSRNDKIGSFFLGFAIIAQKTNLPVVPIRLYNLDKVFPPGALLIRDYPVAIIIGKPMTLKEGETQQAFADRVRAWIQEPHEIRE